MPSICASSSSIVSAFRQRPSSTAVSMSASVRTLIRRAAAVYSARNQTAEPGRRAPETPGCAFAFAHPKPTNAQAKARPAGSHGPPRTAPQSYAPVGTRRCRSPAAPQSAPPKGVGDARPHDARRRPRGVAFGFLGELSCLRLSPTRPRKHATACAGHRPERFCPRSWRLSS